MTSKPACDQPESSGGELFRFGAHQLTADGVFIGMDMEEMLRLLPLLDGQQKLVQHHFAQRIAGAVLPRDQTHRQIAVARQGGLHDRKIDRYIADSQRRRHRSGPLIGRSGSGGARDRGGDSGRGS